MKAPPRLERWVVLALVLSLGLSCGLPAGVTAVWVAQQPTLGLSAIRECDMPPDTNQLPPGVYTRLLRVRAFGNAVRQVVARGPLDLRHWASLPDRTIFQLDRLIRRECGNSRRR